MPRNINNPRRIFSYINVHLILTLNRNTDGRGRGRRLAWRAALLDSSSSTREKRGGVKWHGRASAAGSAIIINADIAEIAASSHLVMAACRRP